MSELDRSSETFSLSRRAVPRRGVLAAGVAAGAGRIGATRAGAQAGEASATPSAASLPDDFKVVLHAAEIDHWNFVVSNLRNLMQE